MSADAGKFKNAARRWAIPAALCVMVLLGAALRLHGLTYQSLWNDELSAWTRSDHSSLAEVLEYGAPSDTHPPGHHVLLYFAIQMLGDSETALRLPAVIFGILSILAIYWLGATIYTPKDGLLGAALLATSWVPLYYSQEARPNSLLVLMSILSALAWFRMARDVQLQQRPRWSSVTLYVLAASVTCYLHYFGLLLVFLQGFYSAIAFARQPKALIRAGVGYLAILALYAPWFPGLLADLARAETWIPKPTLGSLLSYSTFLFSESKALAVLAAAALGMLALGQIRALKRPILKTLGERFLDPTFVLLAWLIVPVLAVYIKSLVSTPVFTSRNLMICLPAAYLLLAHALSVLSDSIRIGPVLLSVGAVLLSVGLAAHVILGLDYYTGIHKEQFREAVQHVVDNSAEYPNSVVIGCIHNTRYLEYYFEYWESPRSVRGPILTGQDVPLLEQILEEESPDYIWYVAAHLEPAEDLLQFMAQGLREVESQDFLGAKVWLYGVPRVEPGQSP